MKYILTLLLLLVAGTSQAASVTEFRTSVSNAPDPYQGKKHRPVKIATIYPDQQTSDYWRRNLTSMTARLDDLHIAYRWDHYSSRPQQVRQQEMQLTEALAHRPDFLVISINSPRIRKLLSRVLYQGTTQVIIPNQTTANEHWKEFSPLLYTGFDHQEGSRMLATYLFDKHGSEARYAIICGTRGKVSELRTQGFHQIAIKRHAAPPVAEYYTDQDPQRIAQAATDILTTYPQLDFIFCTTTDIALTTAETIDTLNRKGTVSVNGWGGGEDELEALKQGNLTTTVMRMNDDTGVSIAEAIKYILEGREDQIPNQFSGEMALLSVDNLCQIDVLKKQAFRYSESP